MDGGKSNKVLLIRSCQSMKKTALIVLCVLASLMIPIFIQSPLNFLFRDLFNPPDWIILQPHLRVISTILCFAITYGTGYYLLNRAKSKKWLFVLHAVLTFLWCGLIALLAMPD